jgi:hypothetical protein
MGSGRRAATAQRQVAVAPADVKREPGAVDPAFHRAILKIALELKKPSADAFRRYLGENGARNMSLLLATARRPGL